jgi:hypothetical protein
VVGVSEQETGPGLVGRGREGDGRGDGVRGEVIREVDLEDGLDVAVCMCKGGGRGRKEKKGVRERRGEKRGDTRRRHALHFIFCYTEPFPYMLMDMNEGEEKIIRKRKQEKCSKGPHLNSL